MNEWFTSAVFKEAEARSIEADRADRNNQRDRAIALHLQAADAFARLAHSVPGDHPNTRSDLAIAAAVSYGAAGYHHRAIELAEVMLAQQGMLSTRGRGELTKIIEEYVPVVRAMIPLDRKPAMRASQRSHRMRDRVRALQSAKPEAA